MSINPASSIHHLASSIQDPTSHNEFYQCDEKISHRHHRIASKRIASKLFLFISLTFFVAIPSEWTLKRTGFKGGDQTWGYWLWQQGPDVLPAAMNRTYIVFLLGLFVAPLAILQIPSNPYITAPGPPESA